MLNKIFIAAVAFFSLLTGFFTYYSWSWLQSIGAPRIAIEGYAFHASMGWTFVWIGVAVLLVLANIILLRSERSWALWTTFGFFTVFVIAKYFWVGTAALEYERQNSLPVSGSILGPFLAVILCLIFGAFVYADQLLAVKLLLRIYPQPEEHTADYDESELSELKEDQP